MSVVTLDPHCRQLYMRSCGQCEGYVLVSGPLREPTMSRVETLPDEPAWHESKEHACGIRATNGKEGVSAERCATPCRRRRQAWLLVRKESVRGDRLRTCGAHTKELPACDHGRGKRGLQRDRRRLRGEGGRPSRERFARSGRARCASCADERKLRFLTKCGRQKRLERKILLLLLAAAGYGGAGFQLVHKFL